jgi:hypothetical protein
MLEYNVFERLPSWSQVAVLKATGTRLGQRQHQDWTITLYIWQHRFVEVWSRADLEVVTSFHHNARPLAILDPYMQQIDLAGLQGLS